MFQSTVQRLALLAMLAAGQISATEVRLAFLFPRI